MKNETTREQRREMHSLKWHGGTITYRGGTLPAAGVLALLDYFTAGRPVDLCALLTHLVNLCGALERRNEQLASLAISQAADELGQTWEAEHCTALFELAAVAYDRGGNEAAVNSLARWIVTATVS